jgi:asparagine synthase (glutamine-hydrolysing)
MCGIVGYFRFLLGENPELNLEAATCSLAHRGPDDQGIFVEDQVGLGHRRLSIIDLSPSGHQPMASLDERFVIVFNGEIYNYRDLKSQLEQLGHRFRSSSDTEVILAGFQQWGRTILAKLNGIFALALWDRHEKRLLVARDRLGVKPFYFHRDASCFIFGSEIKSLLALRDIPRQVDIQGLHEFLYFGNCLGSTTLFRGIQRLEPGAWMELAGDDTVAQGTFWTHEEISRLDARSISEGEAAEQIANHLDRAVQRQLTADVPVGVFLSGGIDSSAITALAVRHYPGKIATFSAGFDFDGGHNELPAARKIASQLGTDHHEIMIYGGDLPDTIRTLVRHHDEPFSDAANLPLYLMTRQIREQCRVILQGDGGDELFGGYNRYRLLHQRQRYQFVFFLLKRLRFLAGSQTRRNQIDRFSAIFSEKDPGIRLGKFLTLEQTGVRRPELMLSPEWMQKLSTTNPFLRYQRLVDRFRFLENDPVQALFWVDSAIILPDQFLEKVDKSTMANGVEVRVPFLDNDLASFALSLPSRLKIGSGVQKKLLKLALRGIVPDEVLSRPKKGFGVPYSRWLRGPLKEFMLDLFRSHFSGDGSLFSGTVLERRVAEHAAGTDDWGFALWKALNLAIWLEEYRVSN